MVPVHQLSVAPGYSLSPALHTQPSSAAVLPAAVAGAISLPILRVLLQVPSDFSEPVNQLESKMFWRLAGPAHHPPGTSGPAPGVHNHRRWWSGGSPGPTLVLPGAWLPCCPDLMPWLACVPTKPVLRLNRSTQDYKVIADKESSRKNCVKISSTLPKHATDDTAPFQSVCSL